MNSILRYSLLICLLFLKGFDPAKAAAHSSSFDHSVLQDPRITNLSGCHDQEYLVYELPGDLLDNDDDDLLVKKKSSLPPASILYNDPSVNTGFPASVSLQSTSHNNRGYLAEDLYLSQRVLRI